MADSIITDDFIDLGTITSRTEVAAYPDDNIEEYWHLKRRFRANDVIKTDWLLKFDFGAAKTVEGVFLNDVNFDKVQIQGDNEVDFGAPIQYDSGIIDIGLDERVNRYKVFIPITGFNLQWMRIYIPATATAVGSYQTKWEVGSVVVLDTVPTVSKNAMLRTSAKPFQDISLPSGGFERISLGDNIRWEGEITIEQRAEVDEAEYWAINLLDSAEPLIFYENAGDTDKAYLCLRDSDYAGTRLYNGLVRGNTIKLKELV